MRSRVARWAPGSPRPPGARRAASCGSPSRRSPKARSSSTPARCARWWSAARRCSPPGWSRRWATSRPGSRRARARPVDRRGRRRPAAARTLHGCAGARARPGLRPRRHPPRPPGRAGLNTARSAPLRPAPPRPEGHPISLRAGLRSYARRACASPDGPAAPSAQQFCSEACLLRLAAVPDRRAGVGGAGHEARQRSRRRRPAGGGARMADILDRVRSAPPTRDAVVSLHRDLKRSTGIGLPLRLWDGTELGQGELGFRMVLQHPWSARALLRPPFDLSAGEAYAEGAIDIEGDIEAAMATGERLGAGLPAGAEPLARGHRRLDVALDVDRALGVGLAGGQVERRAQQRSGGPGVLQDHAEAELALAELRAIPQAQGQPDAGAALEVAVQ